MVSELSVERQSDAAKGSIGPVEPMPAGAAGSAALKKEGRIPSLDGLRAVSILLVIGGHTANAITRPRTGRDYDGLFSVLLSGALGVSVFFVISGFVITHLLQKEMRRRGKIDLPGFYVRRTFRIWPAFFVYLATIFLLERLGLLAIGHKDILAAGFFIFNYAPHVGNWWVAHSWSLSVEEQFYLFWPLALLLTGLRRGAVLATALLFVAPVVRIVQVLALPASSIFNVRMGQMVHTRVDTLMFGCLLALVIEQAWFRQMLARCYAYRAHWLAVIVLVPAAWFWKEVPIVSIPAALRFSIEGVCIALIVATTVCYKDAWFGRVLNSGPLVHIGHISYSLYLWQQLFLVSINHTWTGRFPLNIGCAFVAAEISYHGIERPFLWWRSKLTRPKSVSVPATTTA